MVRPGLGDAALRTDVSRALLLALLGALGTANACTTNHDALARQPKAGSSAGGSAGAAGFGMGAFGNVGNQASQGGRPNPDDESMGDNVLTIVNGVVDAPSVRLCFARLGEDGQTQAFVGSPLPELAYAASTVLTAIDGLSFVDDAIQPWVISGELSRLKKLDCAAAVELAQSEEAKVTPVEVAAATLGAGGQAGAGAGGAGGEGGAQIGGAAGEAAVGGAPAAEPLEFPTLRARPVAALPAGTVNIGRSILLVLTGCIGGAAYTDHIEKSVCGPAYMPATPTLEPVIVKLSRVVGTGRVGLQAVHGSQPTASLDVRASGDSGAVSLVFASSVTFGAIEPRPADTRFTPFELGVENFNYGLQAVDNSGGVAYQEAWSDILTASGLSAILPSRTYTAIFLGPDPLLIKEGWWNKSAFALVDNDPTRE
jgi:hypothetical protein